MDTQTLLNLVNVPNGSLRRTTVQLYDKITLATGTTLYSLFSGPVSQFVRNLQLPISGQEIYAVTRLKLFINTQFLAATNLIELLQKSRLQILVGSKEQLNIPLAQCLSFLYSTTVGATTAIANRDARYAKRDKKFIYPIILGQSSNVQINVITTSTAATNLNGTTIGIQADAIQSTVLDPAFNYSPNIGNVFQDIDYTLWNTISISTANQNTFQCFKDNTLIPNLASQNLPLSSDQRFELQNIEILFVSDNVASQAETLSKIFNNRQYNELSITVNNTIMYKSNLSDLLSIVTEYSNIPYNDNAATPVTTNLSNFELLYQNKTLEIPVIFPATGLINVQLTQPNSSLNNGELFTIMLNGVLKRTVN